MKTLFIPCTIDGLNPNTGSATLRAQWPAEYLAGAEVYDGTQPSNGWDLVVFQKAYLGKTAQGLLHRFAKLRARTGSPSLAFDLCDPDFLEPEHSKRMLDVLPQFDFATAPTPPLVEWLGHYLPAYLLPDGVNPRVVEQHGRELFDNDQPELVWMGYNGNHGALLVSGLMDYVKNSDLHLTVIALSNPKPIDDFLDELTGFDILLNPRPEVGKYRFKSNNKTLLAWSCGVAVAESVADLEDLLNSQKRSEIFTKFSKSCILEANNIRNFGETLRGIYEFERKQ